MMEELKLKAEQMLQRCDIVVLASINSDGYPRPVPLVRIATEGLATIWVATGTTSVKTSDFERNPKAGICFYEKGNSVALTGEVEIVKDEASKEKYWQQWFINFFPQGVKDPEYTLLKFQGTQATIYIDNVFEHLPVE